MFYTHFRLQNYTPLSIVGSLLQHTFGYFLRVPDELNRFVHLGVWQLCFLGMREGHHSYRVAASMYLFVCTVFVGYE